MPELLTRYQSLLETIDAWFCRCQTAHPAAIACAQGCSDCCRGLFDITLLDAALLRSGFDRLDRATQERARQQAEARLAGLTAQWPGFAPPYLLNLLPEEEWCEFPEDDPTPCPLLDENGRCLVYAQRPMTCRLHGLPQITPDGRYWHDEWCSRNFLAHDPLLLPELRFDFPALHAAEFVLINEFSLDLCGHSLTELDTLIPAALLIDFERFDWHNWVAEHLAVLTRHRRIY